MSSKERRHEEGRHQLWWPSQVRCCRDLTWHCKETALLVMQGPQSLQCMSGKLLFVQGCRLGIAVECSTARLSTRPGLISCTGLDSGTNLGRGAKLQS